MIKEDYISFETAKLLKEKGMNKSCFKHYVQKNNNDGTSEVVTVCTLQMAMKWLREIHNIFIQIELYSKYDNYCFEVFKNTHRLIVEKDKVYNSYEEACEEAITYCLENLVNNQSKEINHDYSN